MRREYVPDHGCFLPGMKPRTLRTVSRRRGRQPGFPLAGIARYRREGDFISSAIGLIDSEGGKRNHIVRVDQYYPRAECVNPYQRARKALLSDFVPPSTSY